MATFPTFFSKGIEIYPNAQTLFSTQEKLVKAKRFGKLTELYFKKHNDKRLGYEAKKKQMISRHAQHFIKFSQELNEITQKRALKVDRALRHFLPEAVLKPFATIGLEIGSLFSEIVERIVGGYRADLELMKKDVDRWIELTLMQNIFRFYSGKIDLDRENLNPLFKILLSPTSLSVPFDPVRAPNMQVADRGSFLRYLDEVQALITQYTLRIDEINQEIRAIENGGGPPNSTIRDQLQARKNAFQQEINSLNETNFNPESLVDVKFKTSEVTGDLNSEIERECRDHPLEVGLIDASFNDLQDLPPLRPLTSLQKKLAQQFISSYQEKVGEMTHQIRNTPHFENAMEEERESLVDKFNQLCQRSLTEALQIPEELVS